MPPVNGLLLTQKAEVKVVKLLAEGELTGAMIKTILKRKDVPEMMEPYSYKGLTLYVFGFTCGKAGTENKHELPPPHDSTLFFGDILLVASKDKKSFSNPVTLKPEDYEQFYTKAFGGFDDTEDAEEDEDDDEEAEEIDEEVGVDAEAADDEVGVDVEVADEEEAPRPVARRRQAKPVIAPTTYASFVSIHPNEQLKEETENTPLMNAPFRQKIVEVVVTMFDTLMTADECAGLERCIYNGTIREAERRHVARTWAHPPFVHLYQMHARHVAGNFHPDSYVGNKELFQRYKAGQITFDDLCGMSPYDLFETRWKESFEQQQIREKRQLEGDKSMATDQFLCTRCWKRECTYYEMQTRSADEPMTIFITCLNCGKHWRQ